MAFLPIPAKMYFKDFAFALEEYTVERNSKVIGSYQGLSNEEGSDQYISFLIDADIKIGDVLTSNNQSYFVKSVDYDTYNGNPELIKAHF